MKPAKEWEVKTFEAILNRHNIDMVPCEYNGIETQCLVYVTPRGAHPLAVLVQPATANKLKIGRMR